MRWATSSPAIKKQLAAEKKQAKSRHIVGVPTFFYGRRGGPLKFLDAAGNDAPAAFERPINRLLRNTGSR